MLYIFNSLFWFKRTNVFSTKGMRVKSEDVPVVALFYIRVLLVILELYQTATRLLYEARPISMSKSAFLHLIFLLQEPEITIDYYSKRLFKVKYKMQICSISAKMADFAKKRGINEVI